MRAGGRCRSGGPSRASRSGSCTTTCPCGQPSAAAASASKICVHDLHLEEVVAAARAAAPAASRASRPRSLTASASAPGDGAALLGAVEVFVARRAPLDEQGRALLEQMPQLALGEPNGPLRPRPTGMSRKAGGQAARAAARLALLDVAAQQTHAAVDVVSHAAGRDHPAVFGSVAATPPMENP